MLIEGDLSEVMDKWFIFKIVFLKATFFHSSRLVFTWALSALLRVMSRRPCGVKDTGHTTRTCLYRDHSLAGGLILPHTAAYSYGWVKLPQIFHQIEKQSQHTDVHEELGLFNVDLVIIEFHSITDQLPIEAFSSTSYACSMNMLKDMIWRTAPVTHIRALGLVWSPGQCNSFIEQLLISYNVAGSV